MKPFIYDALLRKRPWIPDLLQPKVKYLKDQGIKCITSFEDDERLKTHFLEYVLRAGHLPTEWVPLLERAEYREQIYELVRSNKQFSIAYQTFMFEYGALLNFELSGRKVFYFDGRLIDKLVATIADAPSQLLRLPFPSCFFVIDYPPFMELCDSIFSSGSDTDLDTPLSISATESLEQDGLHLTFIVFKTDYATLRHWIVMKRSLLITPGRSVEDALRTKWSREAGEEDNDSQWFSGTQLTFYRTLANCILYLSSRTADLVAEKSPLGEQLAQLKATSNRWRKQKRQLIATQRKEHSHLDYVHVGGKITVAPFRPFMKGVGLEEPGYVLLKRILVRGHWRAQPYGRKSSLRKLIFIEPYWKGPELAEEVTKPYDVRL